MTVLGSSIALPSYAIPEKAYPWTQRLTDEGLYGQTSYTTPGQFLDIIAAFFVTVTTDATVGDRTMIAEVVDAAGHAVFVIPAPAVQGPSLTYNYQFLASSASAYGPIGRSLVAPLPQFVLFQGWSFVPRVDGPLAGDTWDGLVLSLTHIPTGEDAPVIVDPVPVPLAL